jgi:hypothetical protein
MQAHGGSSREQQAAAPAEQTADQLPPQPVDAEAHVRPAVHCGWWSRCTAQVIESCCCSLGWSRSGRMICGTMTQCAHSAVLVALMRFAPRFHQRSGLPEVQMRGGRGLGAIGHRLRHHLCRYANVNTRPILLDALEPCQDIFRFVFTDDRQRVHVTVSAAQMLNPMLMIHYLNKKAGAYSLPSFRPFNRPLRMLCFRT